MPELPEVETFKRYINNTSLHHKISDITVRNSKILEDISEKSIKKDLENKQFVNTSRHGKYIFIKTNDNDYLVFHFGMTGFIKYLKHKTKIPKHTRLLITFQNDYNLAYVNQRLFGKVNLINDKHKYIKDKKLGDDALDISLEYFNNILKNKKSMIKSLLMNQSYLAGIGNIYADEVLFQSGIHPETKSHHLSQQQIKTIYDNMKNIFQVTINVKADFEQYPETYIIPKRKKQGVCPKGNESLQTIKVNNRTTYFCPVHQKKRYR